MDMKRQWLDPWSFRCTVAWYYPKHFGIGLFSRSVKPIVGLDSLHSLLVERGPKRLYSRFSHILAVVDSHTHEFCSLTGIISSSGTVTATRLVSCARLSC